MKDGDGAVDDVTDDVTEDPPVAPSHVHVTPASPVASAAREEVGRRAAGAVLALMGTIAPGLALGAIGLYTAVKTYRWGVEKLSGWTRPREDRAVDGELMGESARARRGEIMDAEIVSMPILPPPAVRRASFLRRARAT